MHKGFYASGFIYHPPTGQILLQKRKSATDTQTTLSMFGGVNLSGENAQGAFQRIIHKLLHLKLNPKSIYPVYTYFCKDMKRDHYIIYAELEKIKNFSSKKTVLTWFSFKQAQKLQATEQTKHDITVSQRVIEAKKRKSLGQRTLE